MQLTFFKQFVKLFKTQDAQNIDTIVVSAAHSIKRR